MLKNNFKSLNRWLHTLHTMKLMIFSLIFLVQSGTACEEQSLINTKDGRKFSSIKHGDHFLHGLISITKGIPCTEITTPGLLRAIAFKFSIETRATLSNINTTLGYQIDGTCVNIPVTMSRGIEITNQQRKEFCLSNNANTCGFEREDRKKLLGIISASFSLTTVPLASLLGVYNIPLVSSIASTPLLSKKTDFPSTFRSIPSDEFQVEAMISVIKYFNWTYIFTVGANDDYGKLALSHLRTRSSEEGICITGDVYIPYGTKSEEIAKKIALSIQEEERATVVVLFTFVGEMGDYIIEEAEKLNLKRIWLTSEAWNPYVYQSTRIPKNQLSSIITISLVLGEPLPAFVDYLQKTVKTEYKCNIWLHEYIKQNFQCKVQSINENNVLHGFCNGGDVSKNCTVKTSDVVNMILKNKPAQVNNLINSVDSVTHAFNNVASTKCKLGHSCEVTTTELFNALKNVSFITRQGKLFSYNENGNPSLISYSIEQLQFNATSNGYEYVAIGKWINGNRSDSLIDKSKFVLPKWTLESIPNSTCSITCQPGEERVGVHGCCWKCQECPDNTISNDTNLDECIPCPVGHHTITKIICVKTPVVYLNVNNPIGIVTITFSLIGVILVIAFIVILFLYNDIQAIKEWSRLFIGLSVILLLLTFAYTFVQLVEPSNITCRLRHILLYLILTFYSVLILLKDEGLVRFVSKIINKKKDLIIYSQILIFSLAFGIGIILILVWQWNEEFHVQRILENYEYFETCELRFTPLHLVCFGYPSLILLLALVQTLSEGGHNLNENRELKYLNYTCLAFSIISIAYIVTVQQVNGVYQSMVTLFTTIAYGYVYIGCMIVTKLFHTVLRSSRNNNKDVVHGRTNSGFQNDTLKINNNTEITLSKYDANET